MDSMILAGATLFVLGFVVARILSGVSRFLDRQDELRHTRFFEGSSKDVYDKAEAKAMKQRTPSAWSK